MAPPPPPLPDDALADILRLLPPRSLAAARCVCKPWRALVDGLALLRPHLLPRSVHGVLLNNYDYRRPHLISRPGYSSSSSSSVVSGCRIDGKLSFVARDTRRGKRWHVIDHCDGLLLCGVGWNGCLCVCNPATRRWATLPQRPNDEYSTAGTYLVFDPAVSPHYEVFLIPSLPEKPAPPEETRSMSFTDDEQVHWEMFENNVELVDGMAAIAVHDPRLLLKDQAVGGEGLRQGRRDGDDGGRHDSMELF